MEPLPALPAFQPLALFSTLLVLKMFAVGGVTAKGGNDRTSFNPITISSLRGKTYRRVN